MGLTGSPASSSLSLTCRKCSTTLQPWRRPEASGAFRRIRSRKATASNRPQASTAGEFNVRADASKHSGDYAKDSQRHQFDIGRCRGKDLLVRTDTGCDPLPSFRTDMDMKMTFVNHLSMAILKVNDRKEVVGRPCHEWKGPYVGPRMWHCSIEGRRPKNNIR